MHVPFLRPTRFAGVAVIAAAGAEEVGNTLSLSHIYQQTNAAAIRFHNARLRVFQPARCA